MPKQKDVYIGHGPAFETAAGINTALIMSSGMEENLAAERGRLSGLKLTELFVIYSGGNPPRLFSAIRDANSKENILSQATLYSAELLQEYLRNDRDVRGQKITDHIIITNTDLVEKVELEIRKLGLKPILIM